MEEELIYLLKKKYWKVQVGVCFGLHCFAFLIDAEEAI